MEQEYLEAEQYTENGEVKYRPKGKIDERITNFNGRNKIIKNGKNVRIDIKLIEYRGKKVFKVREY